MKTLTFKTNINAPRQKVWTVMLNKPTYEEWVGVSWPTSSYEGKWQKGNHVKFVGPDGSGTLAHIKEHQAYELTLAEHVAVLNPGGAEDRDSDTAKGWIGTTECYTFTEIDGVTELKVEINTLPDWIQMFEEGWPGALKKLKQMCERD